MAAPFRKSPASSSQGAGRDARLSPTTSRKTARHDDARHRHRQQHHGDQGDRLGPGRPRRGRGPGRPCRWRPAARLVRAEPEDWWESLRRRCGDLAGRSTRRGSRRWRSATSARRWASWTRRASELRPAILLAGRALPARTSTCWSARSWRPTRFRADHRQDARPDARPCTACTGCAAASPSTGGALAHVVDVHGYLGWRLTGERAHQLGQRRSARACSTSRRTALQPGDPGAAGPAARSSFFPAVRPGTVMAQVTADAAAATGPARRHAGGGRRRRRPGGRPRHRRRWAAAAPISTSARPPSPACGAGVRDLACRSAPSPACRARATSSSSACAPARSSTDWMRGQPVRRRPGGRPRDLPAAGGRGRGRAAGCRRPAAAALLARQHGAVLGPGRARRDGRPRHRPSAAATTGAR